MTRQSDWFSCVRLYLLITCSIMVVEDSLTRSIYARMCVCCT